MIKAGAETSLKEKAEPQPKRVCEIYIDSVLDTETMPLSNPLFQSSALSICCLNDMLAGYSKNT